MDNFEHPPVSAVDSEVRHDVRTTFADVLQLRVGTPFMTDDFGRVVFLESANHLDYALRLSSGQGSVFSPAPAGGVRNVVVYEGGVSTPGDELLIGDGLLVSSQDYLSTPFVVATGATIVLVTGAEDYDAYLQDADLARRTGVFVDQLLQPGVFLADQCALGSTHPCAGAARLYVATSGDVYTAPGGQRLGTVESDVDHLIEAAVAPTSGDLCLNGVVAAESVDRARAERPWLSRYLRALDVLGGLGTTGRTGYRVSGFGGRLTAGLPTALDEPTDAPLVLWNDDEHLICDPGQGRVFQLGQDAARLVELLLITGSIEGSCTLATVHLGLDRVTARAAIEVLTTRLADAGVLLCEVVA
ncbi:daptide biosynthesis RiPP recognition protein [Amycolatopsis sp. cmx-11-12]|uniref:daptide biosynthesis RiPP recognition protein n=1 Tax=Amycolatopsis sp. cmx-11-12 TaxID=2785795 RepID=UPI0039180A03